MRILTTDSELVALLSVSERNAYLGDEGYASNQRDMIVETISMSFDSPAPGHLEIKAAYKAGEKHFIIKFASEFQSVMGDSETIIRNLILLGDAHTGVIIAMRSQGGLTEANSKDNKLNKTQETIILELSWQQIQACLENTGNEKVWEFQKQGFQAFSLAQVTIPEVIYLPFKGQGDLHLKGAHKKGGDIYVFKIATAFPGNAEHDLQISQGMMMAFDATTGEPLAVLRDEGHLTDLRTAIAGRNAAQELMPASELIGIGVLGTGVQARLQLALLHDLYPLCRQLTVWGHTPANTEKYVKEMTENGWQVSVVEAPKQVAQAANVIVTTTPSEVALLDADDITRENTLLIAIGADMPDKVELAPRLLKKAECVLIDSIVQGKDHGNAAGAIRDGVITDSDLQEFGDFLNYGLKKPEMANKLRLFLSSGIGVQDLQIVQAVLAGSRY
jgi:ornithine cyclodeaminase